MLSLEKTGKKKAYMFNILLIFFVAVLCRLTVVLQNKVFVYHFSLPPQLLHTFETCDNEKGIFFLQKKEREIIAVYNENC